MTTLKKERKKEHVPCSTPGASLSGVPRKTAAGSLKRKEESIVCDITNVIDVSNSETGTLAEINLRFFLR